MDTMELLNALLPHLLSIAVTVVMAIAGWVGTKLGKYIDEQKNSKQIREIVAHTVRYVEQVAKDLGSEQKLELAKARVVDYANTKGLRISEIEVEILIEAFVNELNESYSFIHEPDVFEVTLEGDDNVQSEGAA